jgi:hypothetical protein
MKWLLLLPVAIWVGTGPYTDGKQLVFVAAFLIAIGLLFGVALGKRR